MSYKGRLIKIISLCSVKRKKEKATKKQDFQFEHLYYVEVIKTTLN